MEYIGRGTISNLRNVIKGRVLLFTQNCIYNIFSSSLIPQFEGCDVVFYTNITENPKREEIKQAQVNFKNQNFDVIVAFGGGSVIDFAKAFRFYDYREVPLIAIPTTAGTGSQATQFAVVYINGKKTSLDNPKILPDFVIADSQFVECAPRYLKACSAIDAYCQAIESFWAVKATDESKKYALEAIEICRDYIVQAVNTNDPKANEMMVKAAHLAGKAINISRTTAAHALSYKITSKYNIPHGHAVALSIANLLIANSQVSADNCIGVQGYLYIQYQINKILKIIGCEDPKSFKEYWNELLKNIGLEYNINNLGIIDIESIVNSVNVQRLNNNPCRLLKKDLFEILIY